MNKGTGMGLLVFGIVLGLVGAIMRFAVKVHTTGFNIHTGGVILLFTGIGCAIIGVVLLVMSGRSRSLTQESIQETSGGRTVTEEHKDTSF